MTFRTNRVLLTEVESWPDLEIVPVSHIAAVFAPDPIPDDFVFGEIPEGLLWNWLMADQAKTEAHRAIIDAYKRSNG